MKKLIAAAVAAAILAPITATAGSGPVLYGQVHMALGYIDNDVQTGGTAYKSSNLSSNASRIGIKGSEDLGNGLKAGYLIEWFLGMDGGASLVQRNRAITLSGGFGTALFGKWDTPMKTLGRKVDLFGDRYADSRTLTRSNSYMDDRLNNIVAYVTPNMGGFKATIAYVLDYTTPTGDNTNNDALSANAIYSNGPVFLGAAYTNISIANKNDETDWRLAGSYKMGGIKLVGVYTDVQNGQGTSLNDYDVWELGGAYGFGSNALKFKYSQKSEGLSGTDDGANLWALGFDHKMSKRTSVYADYTRLENDNGSNIAFASNSENSVGAPNGGNGSNPEGFGIGIIHKF